jgi:hypothetical protein
MDQGAAAMAERYVEAKNCPVEDSLSGSPGTHAAIRLLSLLP